MSTNSQISGLRLKYLFLLSTDDDILPLDRWVRWVFNVQCSTFNVQCSTFNVQPGGAPTASVPLVGMGNEVTWDPAQHSSRQRIK
ncbi:hypothetical protein BC826DRAFT_925881 [Russula brevipes]|nr:hypothetical protein BC826DRAFT_925881 [Russula brevipes]